LKNKWVWKKSPNQPASKERKGKDQIEGGSGKTGGWAGFRGSLYQAKGRGAYGWEGR